MPSLTYLEGVNNNNSTNNKNNNNKQVNCIFFEQSDNKNLCALMFNNIIRLKKESWTWKCYNMLNGLIRENIDPSKTRYSFILILQVMKKSEIKHTVNKIFGKCIAANVRKFRIWQCMQCRNSPNFLFWIFVETHSFRRVSAISFSLNFCVRKLQRFKQF